MKLKNVQNASVQKNYKKIITVKKPKSANTDQKLTAKHYITEA